jgi:transcriptional regulator with XRE-family HTH domain
MPVKSLHPWAKYRRAAGFTQDSVADVLSVSRHYVIRLEQSLFTSPPKSISIKLSELYGIELGIFEASYYAFVRFKREEFAGKHGSFEKFFTDPYIFKKHPLEFYRDAYSLSRMGLCKGLCLHYDPISEYEKNKQREVPDQLKEACEEIGWDVKPLRRAVADWRTSGRADATRSIYR